MRRAACWTCAKRLRCDLSQNNLSQNGLSQNRRLVARTLAQPFSQQLDAACHSKQYALSTRAGAEALLHSLQTKTPADSHLTVHSVDISAACDTVSREAMLFALREVPQASALMLFVRLSYARESVYVWAV